MFHNPARSRLEEALPAYLYDRRWFGGKARQIKRAVFRDRFRLRFDESVALVTFVEVAFDEGSPEQFLLPLTYATGDRAAQMLEATPHDVIVRIEGGIQGVLYDALNEPGFATALLRAVTERKRFHITDGEIVGSAYPGFEQARGPDDTPLTPTPFSGQQSNSTIFFGDRLIMKVFRRLERGINPELEVGRYLTVKRNFPNVAPVLGGIEHKRRWAESTTIAVLDGFVPHQANAWRFTLDELSRFYERILALPVAERNVPAVEHSLLELAQREVPPALQTLINPYLALARLLGQRTAEMHLALAAETDDPDFAPEIFSTLYQRSVYQSMRNLRRRVLDQLRGNLGELPDPVQANAQKCSNARTS